MTQWSKHFWYCNSCGAQNHEIDGECQYCECGGADCQRDSCSAPEHFHYESGDGFLASHSEEPVAGTRLKLPQTRGVSYVKGELVICSERPEACRIRE